MAGFTTHFSGETEDKASVECGGFARGEFVSEQDYGLGEVTEFFTAFAEELSQEAFFEIENVESSFGKIAIAEFFKLFSVAAKDATDCRFRGTAVVANETFDFADQPRVLGHLQVSRKDGAVLLAELCSDELFICLDVTADEFECSVEAVEFGIDGVPGDIASGNAEVFGTQHEHRARDNSGRNCNSSENLHPVNCSGNSGQRK